MAARAEWTAQDIQDELGYVLDGWESEVRELRLSGLELPPFGRKVAVEAPSLLAAVRRNLEETPNQTRATLELGLLMGHWQMSPYAERYRRMKRSMREGGVDGGRKSWKSEKTVTRLNERKTKAISRVEALHRTSNESYTHICEKVGKEMGYSGRQVRRDAIGVRW
jgi:hypothetical protein